LCHEFPEKLTQPLVRGSAEVKGSLFQHADQPKGFEANDFLAPRLIDTPAKKDPEHHE
jgi:hypothetical protein